MDMRRHRQQIGFSLIELIVVILIVGLLMVGSSQMLYHGFRSFFVTQDLININWQASVALERIILDLHATRSTDDIIVAAANEIMVTNLHGDDINYQVVASQLRRNNQLIANNVQAINFSYYDGGAVPNRLLPPLATVEKQALRYVVVTIAMKYKQSIFPVKTAVYLWNIK